MKYIITALLLIISAITASAESCETDSVIYSDTLLYNNDSIPTQKRPSLISRSVDWINNFFMGCDTNYVTPQLYMFTTQAELSYFHDYYRVTSSTTHNHMTLQSGNPLVLGGYVYWSILGFGYSVNLDDIGKGSGKTNTNGYRSSFSLNTARLCAEIYTFRSGKSAKFTSISGIESGNRSFSGLNSKCVGINAQYIFNHKRYSWPAAFGENAVQRKKTGSWKLGISYDQMDIEFNRNELPDDISQAIDTTLLFDRVSYRDYAVSIGYGYNWPFRKNCLLAVSALPCIGYRYSDIQSNKDDKAILRKISTALIFRASLFWNNTRYFTGLILDFHFYSYHQKGFELNNNYGTLKFILGMNFIKKK